MILKGWTFLLKGWIRLKCRYYAHFALFWRRLADKIKGKTLNKEERQEFLDDPYIFLHELGHATDRCGKPVEFYQYGNKVEPEYIDSIRDDKKFKKIYEQERKNFLKEFPINERNYIDYFIEKGNNANPNTNVGHAETIAETNAILNTYPTVESQGLRTQYLQQHFPRTIAYLSERLTQTE